MEQKKTPQKRRVTVKDLIIWILIAGTVVAVYIYVSGNSSHNFADTADKFFEAAKRNNYMEAINYLSENLKSTMTPLQLEKYINQMADVDYRLANWQTRTISDNVVELMGLFNSSETGKPSEVNVIFIMNGGNWKILSVKMQYSGDAKEKLTKSIPPLDSLKSMADSSLTLVANSVKAGNYFDLYKTLSRNWRLKTSEAALKEKFSKLQEQNIDLTPSETFGLVFSEVPVISPKGDLVLKGYYPTSSTPISFVLSYRDEESQWMLDDVDINTQ